MYHKFRFGRAVALLTVCALLANTLAWAQVSSARLGQLVANGGTLVAGDVTFSNFAQVPATVFIAPPLDGFANISASAAVNADGTVSLTFTAIDPVTGTPTPISTGYMQSIAYDVTVTNPAVLLSSVNQNFGSATNGAFNVLTYRAPAPSVVEIPQFTPGGTDGTLIFDNGTGLVAVPPDFTTVALQIQRSGAFYFHGIGAPETPSPLPGGLRQSLGLENFFGVVTDRHSFLFTNLANPIIFDGISMTFSLVPATTPVTPLPVALQSFDVSQPGLGLLVLARIFAPDGSSQPGFAPAGGASVALTTSNPAALPLPASVTMLQGSNKTSFVIGSASVDGPTPVVATATYNGVTLQQNVTVLPDVPLNLAGFGNVSLDRTAIRLGAFLSRKNFSPAVVTLTSSNPTLAPVPASLTIPALTTPGGLSALLVDARLGAPAGTVTFPMPIVAVDTPITFTATFNGVTLTSTVTAPKVTDIAAITKAELVVKNLSLKVDATSTVATAVLKLYNATTGALISTMTNNGPSGSGAKYSFQGTVSPVTSLIVRSSFSGSGTGTVSQK